MFEEQHRLATKDMLHTQNREMQALNERHTQASSQLAAQHTEETKAVEQQLLQQYNSAMTAQKQQLMMQGIMQNNPQHAEMILQQANTQCETEMANRLAALREKHSAEQQTLMEAERREVETMSQAHSHGCIALQRTQEQERRSWQDAQSQLKVQHQKQLSTMRQLHTQEEQQLKTEEEAATSQLSAQHTDAQRLLEQQLAQQQQSALVMQQQMLMTQGILVNHPQGQMMMQQVKAQLQAEMTQRRSQLQALQAPEVEQLKESHAQERAVLKTRQQQELVNAEAGYEMAAMSVRVQFWRGLYLEKRGSYQQLGHCIERLVACGDSANLQQVLGALLQREDLAGIQSLAKMVSTCAPQGSPLLVEFGSYAMQELRMRPSSFSHAAAQALGAILPAGGNFLPQVLQPLSLPGLPGGVPPGGMAPMGHSSADGGNWMQGQSFPPQAPAPASGRTPPDDGLWREAVDHASGMKYRWHKLTKETQWIDDIPQDAAPAPQPSLQQPLGLAHFNTSDGRDAGPDAPSVPPGLMGGPDSMWREAKDHQTGQTYYWHKKSRETRWAS